MGGKVSELFRHSCSKLQIIIWTIWGIFNQNRTMFKGHNVKNVLKIQNTKNTDCVRYQIRKSNN